MKHLRYFKESVEDIGSIETLNRSSYDEYCEDHVILDVTEWDFKKVKRLIESIYEPEEILSVEESSNKDSILAFVSPIIEDGDALDECISFTKFEDHYWLVHHNRQSWNDPDRYWLVGDEDLDKLKNVIFE
jgi:hypothetical protein